MEVAALKFLSSFRREMFGATRHWQIKYIPSINNRYTLRNKDTCEEEKKKSKERRKRILEM